MEVERPGLEAQGRDRSQVPYLNLGRKWRADGDTLLPSFYVKRNPWSLDPGPETGDPAQSGP